MLASSTTPSHPAQAALPAYSGAQRPPLHLLIFHKLRDAVLLYDMRGRIVSANPAAERLLGRPVAELLQQDDDALGLHWLGLDGRELAPAERAVSRALQGRCATPTVVNGLGSVGQVPRWVEITASHVADIAPEVAEGVVCMMTDITDRLEAETAMQASERRLRLFTQHSRDMVWIADRQSHALLYVSPAYERLWGRPMAELQQHPMAWLQAVHPDDRRRVVAGFLPLAAGQAEDLEYRVIHPDGRQVWIRNRGFPIFEQALEVRYVGGIAEDITQTREAEQARRSRHEADARLARFIETAPAAPCTTRLTPGGRIGFDFATPAMAELLGRPIEALLSPGLDLAGLMHPDDLPSIHASVRECARQGRHWRHEFRVLNPERGQVWVEGRFIPVVEADGTITGNGYLLDISERKQAEQEILRLNRELEQRVQQRTAELEAKTRELEAFTYSVSHDLKAPLRGIDGYSRLLLADKQHLLDAEGQLFLQTICRATDQMGRLIDDLLAYSRIERSQATLMPISLRAVVRSILAERADDLQRAGVAVHTELDFDTVLGEPSGLLLVLRNLVDNAMKFSAAQGQRQIRIGSGLSGERALLWVRDNGMGFDMRYHDRIFEIFQRLHRAEDYPGTGVGLAIVRKAVERMNGRLWADSQPGAGATFFVELPLP
jgi:PAS domain S-box-containing protein